VNADEAVAEARGSHVAGNAPPGPDAPPRPRGSSSAQWRSPLGLPPPIDPSAFVKTPTKAKTPPAGIPPPIDPTAFKTPPAGIPPPIDPTAFKTPPGGEPEPVTVVAVPAQIPPTAVADYGTVHDNQSVSPFNDQTFLAAHQAFELAAQRSVAALSAARQHLQRNVSLLGDYYGRAGDQAAEAVSGGFEAAGWWGGTTRLQAEYDARGEAGAAYGYAVSQSLQDYYGAVSGALAGYEARLAGLVEQGVAVGQDLAVEKATMEYQAIIDEYLGVQYASLGAGAV